MVVFTALLRLVSGVNGGHPTSAFSLFLSILAFSTLYSTSTVSLCLYSSYSSNLSASTILSYFSLSLFHQSITSYSTLR